MAVDTSKIAKDRAEKAKGGEFVKIQNGETVMYVCPPCRPDDEHAPTAGLPYIDAVYHYDVGPDQIVHLCLNAKANPVIKHPFILEHARKNGFKLNEAAPCPTCKKIEAGEMNEVKTKKCRAQNRFTWAVVPIRHRAAPTSPWTDIPPRAGPLQTGKMLWDGMVDLFGEHGDITSMDAAVLAKVTRTGKDLNTKYTVAADGATARAPMKLDKAMSRMVRDAVTKDGDCDLFRVVAGSLKTYGEVEAALSGVKTDDEGGDEPPPKREEVVRRAVAEKPAEKAEGVSGKAALRQHAEKLAANPPKSCYALDHADDDECKKCEHEEACALMCGRTPGGKAAAPAAKTSSAAKPSDDGLDELDKELEEASRK